MSLREYLDQFRRQMEKIESYGYAESVEIREEIRTDKQAVLNAHDHFPESLMPIRQRVY